MKKAIIINFVGIFIVCLIPALFEALHSNEVRGIGGYSGLIIGEFGVVFSVSCVVGLIVAFIGKLFNKSFPIIFIKSSWIVCAILVATTVSGTIGMKNPNESFPFTTLFYTFLGVLCVAYLFWENTGILKKINKKEFITHEENIYPIETKINKSIDNAGVNKEKNSKTIIYSLIGIIAILVIVLFFILGNNTHNEKSETSTSSEPKKEAVCEKHASYGDAQICLPEFTGMKECYSNPTIKERADRLLSIGASILAFYLPNQYYEKIDNLNDIPFIYGCFIVWGMEKIKDYSINSNSDLDEAFQAMNNSFKKFNSTKNKTDSLGIFDYIQFENPVLFEAYSPNTNARTSVTLQSFKVENKEFILIQIINMVVVKGKLIEISDYFDYEGKESITKAKAKNDYFILRFLEENASR